MSGYTSELVEGVAVFMDANELGTYRTDDAPYAAGDVRPIYFGPTDRTDLRDDRFVITPLTPIQETGRVYSTPVQFMWRGIPEDQPGGHVALEALDVLDILYQRFQRLRHTFGTIPIGSVLHQSSGVLGPDTARRQGAAATYLFRGRRASANY